MRAQNGVLKELWLEVVKEEEQRAELRHLFPDLNLSPSPRAAESSLPSSNSLPEVRQCQLALGRAAY